MVATRVIIMGAAGRDFHNFNVVFRDDERYEVVAFTATQIPGIEERRYPPELSGGRYPEGIPVYDEKELTTLIREKNVDVVVFAYSDVPHEYVMHRASAAVAAGADFWLLGAGRTQLASSKPVVSIGAVRTGSGKSQTTRYVAGLLRGMGHQVVVIRHPMPYGDLASQVVQRFASYADLDRYNTTIEEREEYEPHLDRGVVVYAGVDYAAILKQAEQEADIILWDGGNNDIPFFRSDFHIVIVDPHRPGHELAYHPGEANLRMANAVVVNKIDTADYENVVTVTNNVRRVNPSATIVRAASPIFVKHPEAIQGARVLVIEDGPTLTHGEMAYGAGVVAARRFGAAEIVDPRLFAVGSIADTYAAYPATGPVLPAMGYGRMQMDELAATINASGVDLVVAATPIDLTRIIDVKLPIERVRYELQVIGTPTLKGLLEARFGG
jgi:predicted GTPase